MKLEKTFTGQRDDYTPGCLLDYAYSKGYDQLIVVDLSKQKTLNPDPRAIQQTVFWGIAGQKLKLYTVLEKSIKTVLEFL